MFHFYLHLPHKTHSGSTSVLSFSYIIMLAILPTTENKISLAKSSESKTSQVESSILVFNTLQIPSREISRSLFASNLNLLLTHLHFHICFRRQASFPFFLCYPTLLPGSQSYTATFNQGRKWYPSGPLGRTRLIISSVIKKKIPVKRV